MKKLLLVFTCCSVLSSWPAFAEVKTVELKDVWNTGFTQELNSEDELLVYYDLKISRRYEAYYAINCESSKTNTTLEYHLNNATLIASLPNTFSSYKYGKGVGNNIDYAGQFRIHNSKENSPSIIKCYLHEVR